MTECRAVHLDWPHSTRPEPLVEGQVQVWAASLDVPVDQRRRLEATLSQDERARAARYRLEDPARRFVVARGVLRELVGMYLDVSPTAIALVADEHGKPALRYRGEHPLEFNVTHSGDLALYAFTLGRRVGVDVERIRPMTNMRALVDRVFSEAERLVFERLGADEQVDAFFSTWTRKEAFVKARGSGIAGQLDKFDVTVRRTEPARLLRVEGDGAGPSQWSLAHLEPAEGFVGAVAVEAPELEFVCRCR